ncbi:MAG: S8 family serine peptidase [Bacteroidota bacterium]
MRNFLLCIMLLGVGVPIKGQSAYLVYLTDKDSLQACPEDILSPEALARRQRQQLPKWTYTDWPVKDTYVEQIAATGAQVRHTLRWPNAISLIADAAQLEVISCLPFVKDIQPLTATVQPASHADTPDDGRLDTLLNLIGRQLHLEGWEQSSYRGKGVRMALFDTGFKEAHTHPALTKMVHRGGIIATKDFYQGDDKVFHHDRHGMEVLSCVAGEYKGRPLGYAPEADFLLARVEHARKELAVEEDHWMAAAEWADQMGADIILSALTYTDKRYSYAQMDGQTVLVSKAAKMATQKGILVVNSIGNEGARPWRFVAAPADVPEVLTVGATFPMIRMRQPYSSFGPNAAGALKPDVCAPGFVVSAWKKGGFDENAGTSFSAPLIAGLAACLLQRDSSLTPADLHAYLCQSAHLYPYYDYALGYGVPDVRELLLPPSPPSVDPYHFVVQLAPDSVLVQLDSALIADTAHTPYGRVLHYHLADPKTGQLKAYHAENLPNGTRQYVIQRHPEAKGLLRIWLDKHLYIKELP